VLGKKEIYPRQNSYGSNNSVNMKRDIVEAAFRDIDSLETESKTKAPFEESLREIASAVSVCLEIGKRNPKELFQLFSSYRVTCDPKIGWQYDTDGNVFVINLLALLYTSAWRLASAFVHEAEHVLFLRSKGMLDAPESKQEEFAQKFRRESEIQAVKTERRFLLSIRRYVPPTTRVFVTKKGIKKGYMIEKIDRSIKGAEKWLRELKESKDMEAKKYVKAVENIALHNNTLIASELGIEMPKPNSEGKYKQLSIVWQALLKSP